MRSWTPGVRTSLLAAMMILGVVSVTLTGLLTRAKISGELTESETKLSDQLEACIFQAVVEAGAISAGLALLLALPIALHMARPLRRLNELAGRIARGGIAASPADVRGAANVRGGREITELGTTLERLAATLRRQDEVRRSTAADITHELRGALAGVAGRLEAVMDGVIDRDVGLRGIEMDAHRLGAIIEDVPRLVEAQRPGLLVVKHRVDLGRVVRERVDAHADRFAVASIALERLIHPVWVDGDHERLAQVVDNLLSNALRYTDPGGRVTVSLRQGDRDAVIEVSDTGIGIAQEHLSRVFDRFWRCPEALDRAAGGSGVGLALVRDLVRAHHGQVEVASRPGRGSRFRISLPQDPRAQPVAPVRRSPALTGAAAGSLVWKLHGDIDLVNAAEVLRELLQEAGSPGDDLTLDLSDVGFFGSSALGVLMAARSTVSERGGQLVIVGVPPEVRRVLDLAGLSGLVDVPVAPLAPPLAITR